MLYQKLYYRLIALILSIVSLHYVYAKTSWNDTLNPVIDPVDITVDDYKDFEQFQKRFTKSTVTKVIQNELQKSKNLENFYAITDNSLQIFASKREKLRNNPEFVLFFKQEGIYDRCLIRDLTKDDVGDPDYPLEGISIALDPGHFGGAMAHIESRYIKMKSAPEIQNRNDIAFDEGTLTFLTAKYLQKLLEEKGASVFLTRNRIGEGSYPLSFQEWMLRDFETTVEQKLALIKDPERREREKEFWLEDASKTEIFRSLYNPLDLKSRADKINAFNPDFTFIIHYNSDGRRDKFTGENIGTQNDYNVVLLPGAFSAYTMRTVADRYNFIRLVVSRIQMDLSTIFAGTLISEFTKTLEVPPVKPNAGKIPFGKYCCLKVPQFTGVYRRNLAMNRFVDSAVNYGETLLQDNSSEAQKLSEKNIIIDGVTTSYRVKEVAEAYFNTVMERYPEIITAQMREQRCGE